MLGALFNFGGGNAFDRHARHRRGHGAGRRGSHYLENAAQNARKLKAERGEPHNYDQGSALAAIIDPFEYRKRVARMAAHGEVLIADDKAEQRGHDQSADKQGWD